MAASDVGVTDAGVPTRQIRSEKTGTGVGGIDAVAQVVLAGVHKRVYVGVQTLVLTGASQSLTVPAGIPAVFADIYAQGATATDYARYWHGGTTPTATTGKKLGDNTEIQSVDPSTFKAINGSGTVTLIIEYYTNG